jgi:kynureninase
MQYKTDISFAQQQDAADELRDFAQQFHIPAQESGEPVVYLCGNSLGLQPKRTTEYVLQELQDWQRFGVEGHLQAKHPWLPYHEFLTQHMAAIVGGEAGEVVIMNTLTVNLHLMMVSFYRPQGKRVKILTDWNPFPSDRYAIASQITFHGLEVADTLIEPQPKPGSAIIETADILSIIETQGDEIALILIGGVNYYSGQLYDLKAITEAGHQKGCIVGFDLAHAAGNIDLQLHDTGCDFAVWCTYKYLNSGPGSLGGCFVHARHAHSSLPRFEGWWGTDKATRFKMGPDFIPIGGVESWQLSNPPILSMAAIRAALEIFAEAGMDRLRKKSMALSGYAEFLIHSLQTSRFRIITPADPAQRGCQLSLQVTTGGRELFDAISAAGIVADWREPDVIRIAPVPLYNSFMDLWKFAAALRAAL